MSGNRVMIVAGEISGDLYGSTVISELKKLAPDLDIYGAGGPKMCRAGMRLLYDSSNWGTIGIVEALKKTPRLYFVYRHLVNLLEKKTTDLLVLIDYPGFNMRLVRAAKKLGIPTLYYFPPAKWAQNPEEVRDAASSITLVAAPFISTAEVYRKAGANVEFVGNPLLELARPSMSREEIYRSFSLDPGKRILALLPGSRNQEVLSLLPILLDAALEVRKSLPDIQISIPVSSSTINDRGGVSLRWLEQHIQKRALEARIVLDHTYDILSVSDAAIVTSGTATLEAACFGLPMAIVYKVSKLTEIIARLTRKIPEFIGLPNMLVGRKIVPEFIQGEISVEKIGEVVKTLLLDDKKREEIRFGLKQAVSHLGETGASSRVAAQILRLLSEKKKNQVE